MKELGERYQYGSFPFGIYGLLLVVVLVFLTAIQGSVFPTHLFNIARNAAPLGIAVMGRAVILLAGGLDLSLGSVMSMVNLVMASMMDGGREHMTGAIVVSLALCAVIGFLNGFIIVKFQMQPFLVAMAMSVIVQGGCYLYTQGVARGGIAREVRSLSEGWLGGIPIAVIIWVGIWIVIPFVLHKTVYGRKLYTTGANPTASRLSGFHVDRATISAYVTGMLLAGIVGIMLSAYIGAASVDIGTDYTLDSIASSVIGGAAFTGGVGGLEGTFSGALILAILKSLMTTLGISGAGKFVCQGVVIAVMVALSQMRVVKR